MSAWRSTRAGFRSMHGTNGAAGTREGTTRASASGSGAGLVLGRPGSNPARSRRWRPSADGSRLVRPREWARRCRGTARSRPRSSTRHGWSRSSCPRPTKRVPRSSSSTSATCSTRTMLSATCARAGTARASGSPSRRDATRAPRATSCASLRSMAPSSRL